MNNTARRLQSDCANAMRRENFFLFAREAFAVIHPGQTLAEAPYFETLCFELQEAASKDGGRLIVTMPPRHLKSVFASIALVAWVLGRDNTCKTIVASYAEGLAKQHARLFKTLVTSSYYRSVFPGAGVTPRVNNATEFVTGAGGGRRAISVGGSVTGTGADIIIIDDMMKADDASSDARREEARRFFDSSLYTRLNDKSQGCIIVVQQRLHQDDLIAHLLEKGTFRHLNLPAIAEVPGKYRMYNGYEWHRAQGDVLSPEREDADVLDQIRADMGEAAFRTQYQQDPASAGTSMLDFARVTLLDESPEDIRSFQNVQVWDTAIKDGENCDYSVGMTFGFDSERWVLLEVIRERMKFNALKESARRSQEKWDPDLIWVEDSANGSALVSDMRAEDREVFKTLGIRGSKEERFAPAAGYLEAGKIALLRNATYFADLRRELLAFPEGRYDDQVDAISLLVRRLRLRREIRRPGTRSSKTMRRRSMRHKRGLPPSSGPGSCHLWSS